MGRWWKGRRKEKEEEGGNLDFNGDGGGALVEDAVARAMVEEAGHAHTLLLATREGGEPITHVIPTPLAWGG